MLKLFVIKPICVEGFDTKASKACTKHQGFIIPSMTQ